MAATVILSGCSLLFKKEEAAESKPPLQVVEEDEIIPLFDTPIDTSDIVEDSAKPLYIYPTKQEIKYDFNPDTFFVANTRPHVRVAILENVNELLINSLGRVSLWKEDGDSTIPFANVRGEVRLVQTEKGVEVFSPADQKQALIQGKLQIKSKQALNLLKIGELSYRGGLEIRQHPKGGLLVINVVRVEDYLRGVLPYEMPVGDRATLEALKAQAVAARNYALSHLNQFEEMGFDLYADTRDQMYMGTKSETFLSDKAVSETRDLVLVYEGEMAQCFYHSTCGGRTANIHQVWRGDSLGYLTSIEDKDSTGTPYCRASKYSNWYEKWNTGKLVKIIERHQESARISPLLLFNQIINIGVVERTQSGRVLKMEILTEKGKINIYGDKTRWALRRDVMGYPILHSSWFNVLKKGAEVLVEGRGYGHGIGMCQMGAMERARRGQDFSQILQSYYRGTQLKLIKSKS